MLSSGPKMQEVLAVLIGFENIADIAAQSSILSWSLGLAQLHRNTILAEIRRTQVFQNRPPFACGFAPDGHCPSVPAQTAPDQASVSSNGSSA